MIGFVVTRAVGVCLLETASDDGFVGASADLGVEA